MSNRIRLGLSVVILPVLAVALTASCAAESGEGETGDPVVDSGDGPVAPGGELASKGPYATVEEAAAAHPELNYQEVSSSSPCAGACGGCYASGGCCIGPEYDDSTNANDVCAAECVPNCAACGPEPFTCVVGVPVYGGTGTYQPDYGTICLTAQWQCYLGPTPEISVVTRSCYATFACATIL